MKQLILLITIFSVYSCQSQTTQSNNKLVGGPCEGCEAIYEYGNKKLISTDTLPNFQKTAPKIKINGIVYQKDGKTPAENIILYIYHTNRNGIYETAGNEKGWAKRHGFIRGWIKTGNDGKYSFYTFRPAAYPNGRESAHIHVTIKEPNKNEYYADNYFFNDDPLLTASKRKALKNRGGSGIVKPFMENGISTVERDFILGLNIPDYK